MEDVEGAENNLGLDYIPQGLGGGMDLCWLRVANGIRGRTLMSGGTGGPRALKAFGKTCKGNKGIGYKALMVYSLGTGKGETTRRERREFDSALYLVIFASCHCLRDWLSRSTTTTTQHVMPSAVYCCCFISLS